MGRYRHIPAITAITLLFVAAAACGSDDDDDGASGTTAAGAGSATNQVEVVEFKFKPEAITVKAGTTVTWTFKDSTDHSVKLDDGSFTSNSLKDDGTATHTFSRAGNFTYKCGIHSSMTGSVTVTA